MTIPNDIHSAIYGKLTAGTALTALLAGTTSVYHVNAPEGVSIPYVIFGLQAGGPINITPSDIREEVVRVFGVAASAKTAGAIDGEASALLHRGTLSVNSYTLMSLYRETDIEYAELTTNGERVYVSGGTYRISLDS